MADSGGSKTEANRPSSSQVRLMIVWQQMPALPSISSHTLEVSPSIIIVHLSLNNLLGQLPLPLARVLCVLQLQAMLVHRIPHCLGGCQR